MSPTTLEQLKAIYDRRPTEQDLSFDEWMESAADRAGVMWGERPVTTEQLLKAMQRSTEQ